MKGNREQGRRIDRGEGAIVKRTCGGENVEMDG